MTWISRVAVAVVVVAGTAAGMAAFDDASATAGSVGDADGVADFAGAQQDPNETDSSNETNVSDRGQVNPGELDRERDLSHVQSWLARQLESQLEQSSDRMQEGEYESAKEMVGERYEERYEQYREVSSQVGGERRGEETEAIGRLQERQRSFLSAVQSYEQTYEQLQAARDNGSETRARRIAHQLQRDERRVNERGEALIETYRNATDRTELNLTENVAVTRNISANVSERTRTVEEQLFVQTELSATAAADTASFADPVVITGQLRAENGSAIVSDTVTFRVGNRTIQTATNDSGGFSIEYAPRDLPANASTVTVEYVPNNTSVYDRSNETLAVTVAPTRPAIEITNAPEAVSFGEQFVVRGIVSADDRGIEDVPVGLAVDTDRVDNATTGENGTFEVRGRLPADATEDGGVRVTIPLRNRAIASANETVALTVGPTDTELTSNVSQTDNGTVRVVGRLRTVDGAPIGNRSVRIDLQGRALAQVETGPNGIYSATVSVPESLRSAENLTVVSEFDGSGTNLRPSRATTGVASGPNGGTAAPVARAVEAVSGAPWWAFLLAGAVLIPVGYGVASRLRTEPDALDDRGAATADEAFGRELDSAVGERDPDELISYARDRLAASDPETATHVAYVAVVRELGDRFDLAGPLTHWEFFTACRDAGLSGERLDGLRKLLQAEERAQFASDGVPEDSARRALAAANSLLASEGSASAD